MRNDDEPSVLAAIEAVRRFIGYIVLLVLSLAFLVMGHTAGRIVGAVLLILWLGLSIRTIREQRFERETIEGPSKRAKASAALKGDTWP